MRLLKLSCALKLLNINKSVQLGRMQGILVIVMVVGLSACSNKEKKAGQVLAKVNGEEITVLQVNNELMQVGVKADQQEAATKKLLEVLIDRQLIITEAKRNKIDRTPAVVQAIERAKDQIIAQAYLNSIVSKIDKSTLAEIDDYYKKHPEYFTQRKQFFMQQLVIATKDLGNDLKSYIDSDKSLEEVALWLGSNNLQYERGQLSRTSADLPDQMLMKLKELKKGELFIVNEGEKSSINSITDIKDSPVTSMNAARQIEQYLTNKKAKEVADAEISHLRSSAKIEYINSTTPSTP